MTKVTPRSRSIITGLIALVLVFAVISVGIKYSFGAFRGGYRLTASFDAAGQGLLPGSNVKIRGVNVGEVKGIELVDGRALVSLRINSGEEVPTTAQAVIRPKTLFGEKFVDIVPGEGEASGPFLGNGDVITDTLGGFELERVLADTYPILNAINPDELAIVIHTLALASDGQGPSVNRQILNSDRLLDVNVAHDADTRQFLADLALLSDELAGRAGDVVSGAQALNSALPVLNSRSAQLNALLIQTSRLASDLADLIEANEPFVRDSIVQGGRTLQIVYDNRDNVVPLVVGLRQYVQTLSEVVRIPVGDGSYMAAVHALLGSDACTSFLGCSPTGTSAGDPLAALVDPTALATDVPIDPGVIDELADLLGTLLGPSGASAPPPPPTDELVETIIGGLLR